MELRHLRAFLVLSEELHFGRAARRLAVAQSALSRTLRALEDEVGSRLLDRTPQRVAITAAGARFRAHAQRSLQSADEALRAAKLRDGDELGELRLGMMIGAAQPEVGRLLARFSRAHPGVRISLKRVQERELGAVLASEQVEAVLAWESSVPEGCQRRSVASVPLAVLVPEGDPLARRRSVSLADLRGRKILLPARDGQPLVYETYRAMCRHLGFELEIAADVDTVSDVLALVAGGLGIGNAPVPLGLRYPGVVILQQAPAIPLHYELVWTQASRILDLLLAQLPAGASRPKLEREPARRPTPRGRPRLR